MILPVGILAIIAIAIFLYFKNLFETRRDERRFSRLEHQQETLERTLKAVRKENEISADSGQGKNKNVELNKD